MARTEGNACVQCLVTKRRLTKMECSAIALVVMGVVMATVTDSTVMTNMLGCLLSGAAILFSAVYQVGSPLKPSAHLNDSERTHSQSCSTAFMCFGARHSDRQHSHDQRAWLPSQRSSHPVLCSQPCAP